jgi:hypothetical protein
MVVVVLLGACGASASEQASEVASFCSRLDDALTGDREEVIELLRDPPPGLDDVAPELIETERSSDRGDGLDAQREFAVWVESRCRPRLGTPDAGASDRRLAPPVAAIPEGLRLCMAITWPELDLPVDDAVVLYGRTGADDPYRGPMLGVASGREEGSYEGDGEQSPVRVRGVQGSAAPIPVFQGVALEELGTVIAWREEDQEVGLFGRHWRLDRVDELVALADELRFVDGVFRFPDDSLPEGYEEVFVGSSNDLSSLVTTDATYQVNLRGRGDQGAFVDISGHLASATDLEAFRFLTLETRRTRLGGREVVTGNAWGEIGPVVVTWREPDGLVVRLIGLGIDLDAAQQLATATRELTRREWIDLVGRSFDCPEPDR